MQKLFKDIYSNADSATQRAMNKVSEEEEEEEEEVKDCDRDRDRETGTEIMEESLK